MPGKNWELRQEPSGPRMYLDGRGLHAGEIIQLYIGDDNGNTPELWICARYEYCVNAGRLRPLFYIGPFEIRALRPFLARWPAVRN